MTRKQRVNMVRFPNRERAERRVMILSGVLFFGIIVVDILLTSIGW